MKSVFKKSCVAGLALALPLAGVSATDAEIKERVVHASTYIDNGRQAWRTLLSAIDLCEGDTNRFERVLRSLVEESLECGNARMAESAMWKIGYFGTTNSLPFLYGCATNAVVGGEAMIAAAKIGGISGEYISHLDDFLAESPADKEGKAYCCEFVLSAASSQGIPAVYRTNLCSIVVRHASENNEGPRTMDDSISSFDSTYVHSRRRLAVMRSIQSLELNAMMQTFVSNTINELVAYPESALGD